MAVSKEVPGSQEFERIDIYANGDKVFTKLFGAPRQPVLDLETLMPARDGGLSLTHNAHICYRRVTSREQNTVIGGIMSGIYKGEYFEDANLVAECIRTNTVWKLKWTPPASPKEHIICGPTLEYVLQRANQINRECEELCSQTDDDSNSLAMEVAD